MNEGNINEMFMRDYRFLSISQGCVLVKKSIFGKIKVKGKIVQPKVVTDNQPHYEDVEVIKDVDLLLRDLNDAALDKLLTRANDAQKTLINNEKKFRAGLIPDTPEMQAATIKVKRKEIERRVTSPRPDIIIRRIEAKLGIRIRLPFQSVLVLSTTEQTLDTPAISVISNDNTTKVEIDTDYRYKIVDAEKYAIELNGLSEQAGITSPSQAIKNNISQSLDDLISNYVKVHGHEELIKKPSFSLLSDLQYEIGKIERQYGIEVTKFMIKSVHPPQEWIDAQMRKQTAEANASAAKAEKGVDNDVLENKIKLLKAAGLDNAQIANILSMQGAKNATVLNIPNMSNMFGGNGQNQGTPFGNSGQNNPQPTPNPNGQNPSPTPTNSNGQNASSSTMDEKSIAIWSTMGFCDEDGCLSRDDSKAIMAHRGQQLAPGRVLMIYELNTEELQLLKQIIIDREHQNQNHM